VCVCVCLCLPLSLSPSLSLSLSSVCVCVSVRDRERERGGERGEERESVCGCMCEHAYLCVGESVLVHVPACVTHLSSWNFSICGPQGNRPEELPEVVLAAARVARVNFELVRPFPARMERTASNNLKLTPLHAPPPPLLGGGPAGIPTTIPESPASRRRLSVTDPQGDLHADGNGYYEVRRLTFCWTRAN
jgi:hypothetical protein